MMKRILLLAFIALPVFLSAQAGNGANEGLPTWAITSTKTGESTYDLLFRAELKEGFVVYSQHINPDIIGPLPAVFGFDTIPGIEVDKEIAETGKEVSEHEDPMWDNAVIKKFIGTVSFTASIKSSLPDPVVSGWFEYQTCNDQACWPDRIYFKVHLAGNTAQICTIPCDLDTTTSKGPAEGGGLCKQYLLPDVDLKNPVNSCGAPAEEVPTSLWGIFILGFLGGLVALLTPCVFPMIPLTVSFFTKGGDDRAKGIRNALTYGAFILGIYLLFSLPFHILGGADPEIFNKMSTDPILNVVFFLIFIVFAISFFGFFEITLPSSWVNRMDQNASRFGGVIGIFFMAFTLALVSFSCTGPILGSLLAGALTADGGAWKLTAGMGGFGMALALPFALFAMFPAWLNNLPRSGGWLNSVKVVLGFVEVAAAVKFYSLADMVQHWNTMPYELFLGIWILCGLGIVLYLLGLVRFPHDSPIKKISPARWGFIVFFSALTVYMCTGYRFDEKQETFKEPKLLSGILPPVGYSWIHPKECPQDLECYHDLCDGMEVARNTGKPIMIDFTGYGCANCRKMEQSVWGSPGVLDLIRDKYVLVSLYVDDRTKLPEAEQHLFTSSSGVKKLIVTEGDRWTALENETFHKLSQPWYVLLSPDGKLLNAPTGTGEDPFSIPEFKAFLECGLDGMEKLK
ncbi:MAG: thioredoxin family protein [Flavobacteriales bacterium]|nr:thioredoxin family protein [Flavobacteriales bacterium]